MIRVLTTGRNPTMRYLSLTHGIKINWLHQVSTGPNVKLNYIESELQAADIFTKTFESGVKWATLLPLINIAMPNEFWPLVMSHRCAPVAVAAQSTSLGRKSLDFYGKVAGDDIDEACILFDFACPSHWDLPDSP